MLCVWLLGESVVVVTGGLDLGCDDEEDCGSVGCSAGRRARTFENYRW